MNDLSDATSDALEFRRATTEDLPGIIVLARRALGWSGDAEDNAFFRWKHLENPLGVSPMWLAVDGDRIVGLRAFLRWELRGQEGERIQAARAVDTATDPEYQGRQIFTKLTLGALDELRSDGVRMIFNTPNRKSLPGYLKMGWSKVGRLPVSVALSHPGSALRLLTARRPATRSSITTSVGEPASDVFADVAAVEQLLSTLVPTGGLATLKSPSYLAWRYGHRALQYRVMLHGSSPADGLVVFRLRRRGHAVEAAVCDILVAQPDPAISRSLCRQIAQRTDATYLLRLGSASWFRDRFVGVPGIGPILACRPLDDAPAPPIPRWALALGDIELL